LRISQVLGEQTVGNRRRLFLPALAISKSGAYLAKVARADSMKIVIFGFSILFNVIFGMSTDLRLRRLQLVLQHRFHAEQKNRGRTMDSIRKVSLQKIKIRGIRPAFIKLCG
jgi:hypothetical protein